METNDKHIRCEACGQYEEYKNGGWSCSAEITAMDSLVCLSRNLLQLTVMTTVKILDDHDNLDSSPREPD